MDVTVFTVEKVVERKLAFILSRGCAFNAKNLLDSYVEMSVWEVLYCATAGIISIKLMILMILIENNKCKSK